ncbi:uncharacterized protein N7477_002907 [Penicillium maclennaniae]|uniref:uncharacterized protein n=1 Tax=Penicillium maclennaniae TaxID=1343394 RepID=UPI0025402F0B|nr:uncharacterized protein N7477_002907 [Penicillium maclennaniae]KAJ5677274.1 hypothetical protein N7477_002907 [Penicillium maclennaniae]
MEPSKLQCIICPAQPCFSDTSHLLTHISSKAHLSFYFKLQVRSHQEDDAIGLLMRYDHWFNTNNLAQLLSDRSTTKEDKRKKRKSAAQDAPQLTAINQQPPPKISFPTEPVYHSPQALDNHGDVKLEIDSQDSSGSSWYTAVTDMATDTSVVSKVAIGTGSSQTMGTTRGDEWHECASYCVDEGIRTATLPVTPTASRVRFQNSDIPWRTGNKPSHEVIDARSHGESLDSAEADKERADEMSRLKGVLWPGMDIFDSATQLMRRKRNQKKDSKLLKMMEKTSSQVEPTELIFSPTGTLKKQRVISGNVEDDSPLKGETPVPKPRQPRSRIRTRQTALRSTDPNLPRAQDRKRAKKTPQVHKADYEWHEDSSSLSRQSARLQGLGPSFKPDDDFALSTKAFGQRPRKGFAIFADGDQDEKNTPDQQAARQAPPNTVTPARLIIQSKSAAHHSHQTDHSSLEKENIEPILNPQGRIDLPSWNNSPFLKRCSPKDDLYPRYFLGQPRASDFASDNVHGGFGFCSNPLLTPSTQTGFYDDDNPFEVNISVGSTDWTTATRSASSEATISQDDPQELARLYLNGNAD